jgi:hypothetical protein
MVAWPPRRRRGVCAVDERLTREGSIYVDGTYLISSWGEARTWAVHEDGRWGVVYEWLGEQPVAGWVSAEQIPLEVRARALRGAGANL